MREQDSTEALERASRWLRERVKNYAHTAKRVLQNPWFIAGLWLLVIAADPVAAQGSSLDGVVQVLENIKNLLQNIGLVLAAVSLMASGIAWMLGEVRLAKKLVRGAVIGVLILVLADPIVDFLIEPLQ